MGGGLSTFLVMSPVVEAVIPVAEVVTKPAEGLLKPPEDSYPSGFGIDLYLVIWLSKDKRDHPRSKIIGKHHKMGPTFFSPYDCRRGPHLIFYPVVGFSFPGLNP